MSRSFRHTPIIKGDGFGKQGKRWANKRVRCCPDVADGSWYRGLYPQWCIWDFRFNLRDWYPDDEYKKWIK